MEYGTMCQDFLKEIIPERDFSHLEIISEKSLKNVNHKEIRLDILATDKQGNKYNIEM